VSHDTWSAVGSVIDALIPGSTLWKIVSPSAKAPVQESGVPGVMIPALSAASAMIGLKVEPVG
jgi:hypothetical protein